MDENEELESLLTRVNTGDNTAHEPLLGLLRARARRYAEYLLPDPLTVRVDASDLAQEAFVRILPDFDPANFQTLPQLLAWLNKVVRNAVGDRIRQHRAQKRGEGRTRAGGDLFPSIASDWTGPEERVERNENNLRLEEALKELPENQRAVFKLRYESNLPFDEIAQRLGLSDGNTRVLMNRALTRLATLLETKSGDLS